MKQKQVSSIVFFIPVGFLYLLLWGQLGSPGVAGLMNHKQEQMASSKHHSQAAYEWRACNLTTYGRTLLI